MLNVKTLIQAQITRIIHSAFFLWIMYTGTFRLFNSTDISYIPYIPNRIQYLEFWY